jgi:hypothetical protein
VPEPEPEPEQGLAEVQCSHWQRTYGKHPRMYGEKPSAPVTCWNWAPATAETRCASPAAASP